MGEGDGGFGSAGDFGGSEGFTGSEGASLGGDFSGTGYGDGFGDVGGLGGFGLDAMFSNPEFGFNFDSFSLDPNNPFAGIEYGQDSSLEGALSGLFGQQANNPFSELMQSKLGKALAAILGQQNPLAGKALGLTGLAMSPNPGKGMAGLGLSTLGGMFAGPLGGIALGALGNMTGATSAFGDTVGLQGGTPADGGPSGGGMDMSNVLSGLGGMYAANKSMNSSKGMLGGLQGLYSQNSPYAQMLRQQLQRQDAAGGRRSQYGPREVELQAKLADMASRQIPAMSQLSNQQAIARAQMLKNGIGAFQGMGGINGLKDLFGLGGAGGMFERAGTDLINSGSLGSLFGGPSLDMFGGGAPDLGYEMPEGWDFGG